MSRIHYEVISHELVLNLTPADFPNEDLFRNVMQSIGWFLTRRYSIVGMKKTGLKIVLRHFTIGQGPVQASIRNT